MRDVAGQVGGGAGHAGEREVHRHDPKPERGGTLGDAEPDGFTQTMCALSALRNCSSVTLGWAGCWVDAEEAGGAEISGCETMTGGGPTGKRCPATPARKPATSSTPMLSAGW